MVRSFSSAFDNFSRFISLEDFVFVLTFLVFFGIIYFSVLKVFSKKVGGGYVSKEGRMVWDGGGSIVQNKVIVVVISMALALLATFGMTRNEWVAGNFGGLLGLVAGVFPIIIVIGFLALLFKKLKGKMGGSISWMLVILLGWGALRYIVYYSDLFYSLSSPLQEWIALLAHMGTLIAGLIIGLILGKVMK